MASTTFSGPVTSTAGFVGAVTGNITGNVTLPSATSILRFVPTTAAAAGSSSQANSTAITAPYTVVTTCAATTAGVRLPTSPVAGRQILIANVGVTAVRVYPGTGAQIAAVATNSNTTVSTGKASIFVAMSTTRWLVVAGA